MKTDEQIILETMERTRQMIKERSEKMVEKKFSEELSEEVLKFKFSRFAQNLFLLLIGLSILGYLSVSLWVFVAILCIPFTLGLFSTLTNRAYRFLRRKLQRIEKEESKSCCGSCKCDEEE